jgi:DNA-binding NtrC family response regulator
MPENIQQVASEILEVKKGLKFLKEGVSCFDLVITDQTMPEMTRVELAGEVLTLTADMPIIMCTGFSCVVDTDKAWSRRHQGLCDETSYKKGDRPNYQKGAGR